MYEASLPSFIEGIVVARILPLFPTMQLDNACFDNKNRYTLCFFSLHIANEIFCNVYMNFMLIGYTHDNIDALFGRWNKKLKRNDYPMLPLLMKSFMDLSTQPHLIEEVPDLKDLLMLALEIRKNY